MVSCDSYDHNISLSSEDSNDVTDNNSTDTRQMLVDSSYHGNHSDASNKHRVIPRLKSNLYCMQIPSREECAKQIYGRKIAIDACLVGELKAPSWRHSGSGYAKISVPPCTFTTASGGSGMKMYPYSTQTSCGCTMLTHEHHNPRRRVVCSRCRNHRVSSSVFPLSIPLRSVLACQLQPASLALANSSLHSATFNQQIAHQHSNLVISQQNNSTPSSIYHAHSTCDNSSSSCSSILTKSIRLNAHQLSSLINSHQIATVPLSQSSQNAVALFPNQQQLRQYRETSFSMPALRGFEMYAHLLRDIHIR